MLLVLEGEVEGEVAGEKRVLKKGEVVVTPPGVKHRFLNRTQKTAITFNVYSPPEY
ncbi:MAG: cupin domain-containing protein [Chthoniobacterales bacterium]